eukprot:11532583-Alexandrium_andersonii.AAC.1
MPCSGDDSAHAARRTRANGMSSVVRGRCADATPRHCRTGANRRCANASPDRVVPGANRRARQTPRPDG